MAKKHRTKQQKKKASTHHSPVAISPQLQSTAQSVPDQTTSAAENILGYPVKLIYRDLIKTAVLSLIALTGLLLIGRVGLSYFLF